MRAHDLAALLLKLPEDVEVAVYHPDICEEDSLWKASEPLKGLDVDVDGRRYAVLEAKEMVLLEEDLGQVPRRKRP